MVSASLRAANRRSGVLGRNRTVEPAGSLDPGRSAQPVAWVDPAYDAAGNMTECPKAGTLADGAAKLKHTWDGWNRLVKVQDAYDCTVAEYQYDGLGRRIAKWRPWLKLETEGSATGSFSVGDAVTDGANGTGILARMADGSWWVEVTGGTTWASSGTITKGANTQEYTQKHSHWRRWDYYYNENWQCVAECYYGNMSVQDKEANAVAGSPYVHYLWDIRYIDAPVCRWWDSDGDETLTDETAVYCCNDANMNVTALVGADGTVAERYLYDPYGRVTFLDASFSPLTNNRSDYDNEILYCGYRYNPESGLYGGGYRSHNLSLGSWIVRDPGSYDDGPNVYLYCSSNPLIATDPDGTIAVIMSGAGGGYEDMEPIKNALVAALMEELRAFSTGKKIAVTTIEHSGGPLVDTGGYKPGRGKRKPPKKDDPPNVERYDPGFLTSYDDTVRSEFEDWVDRKGKRNCLEQFIAVGHSSGGSAIINVLTANRLNKDGYVPAYLATVDAVFSSGKNTAGHKDARTYFVAFYQTSIVDIHGQAVQGADENREVQNVGHLSIPKAPEVVQSIAAKAAREYRRAVEQEARERGLMGYNVDRKEDSW